MQARHFNELAKQLNYVYSNELGGDSNRHDGFNRAVNAVVRTCKQFNSSFSAERFRAVVYTPPKV